MRDHKYRNDPETGPVKPDRILIWEVGKISAERSKDVIRDTTVELHEAVLGNQDIILTIQVYNMGHVRRTRKRIIDKEDVD